MKPSAPASGLYRCPWCSRRARVRNAGNRCEFCGGALLAVWGLGQLAAGRKAELADAEAPAQNILARHTAPRAGPGILGGVDAEARSPGRLGAPAGTDAASLEHDPGKGQTP